MALRDGYRKVPEEKRCSDAYADYAGRSRRGPRPFLTLPRSGDARARETDRFQDLASARSATGMTSIPARDCRGFGKFSYVANVLICNDFGGAAPGVRTPSSCAALTVDGSRLSRPCVPTNALSGAG